MKLKDLLKKSVEEKDLLLFNDIFKRFGVRETFEALRGLGIFGFSDFLETHIKNPLILKEFLKIYKKKIKEFLKIQRRKRSFCSL